VPVSLVGSFHHLRTGHWLLRPATITVFLHATIKTAGMSKEDIPALKVRVREQMAPSVEKSVAVEK
jgi:hypothetical protein